MSQASLIRVLNLYRFVDSGAKQTSVEKLNKEKSPSVSDKAISKVIPFPARTPLSRMINITAQRAEFTASASCTPNSSILSLFLHRLNFKTVP